MLKQYKLLIASFTISLFVLSFLKIHLKIQTTILGYEIGKLKKQESNLLKERSLLTMKLAKITTKESLLNSIESN